MLKAMAQINGRKTLILGLERANMERLIADQPIAIDVQALLQATPSIDEVQDIWLVGGETLADVHADLAKGLPMPPFEEPTAS